MAMNQDAISTFKSHMRNLISKNLTIAGLGLAVWSLSAASSVAADPAMKSLHGHVPSIVAHMTAIGDLSGNTNLQLAIGLPLRNKEALTNLLQSMYDPASPNYHHYLTPEEFTAQFGPSEQDYQAVIDFAKTNGLEVVSKHSNRMLLDVKAKASDVERAFHVTLRKYHHPKENRDFYAPDTEPSVPATLSLQDVSGLSDYSKPQSMIRTGHGQKWHVGAVSGETKASSAQPAAQPGATTGSGPAGNYIGNDFRNAYVPGVALNGSGQSIALVQFDGYNPSDIAIYETMAGRTNVPLQNVLLDGFSGVPGGNQDEVCLDIEMSVSMAPALSKIIVYEGEVPNDVLNAIATANAARQVSCSWGWGGGPQVTTDQIFQQMALQGQSFFCSSADSDAYVAGTVNNPSFPGTPASSPYVTAVGGTTLTMTNSGGGYASETVWNWDIRFGPGADGIGSSGAICNGYAIPYWQTNINMIVPQGSPSFRNMPDVALTADDVFIVSEGGQGLTGNGGTSCASPLWAAFTALINQQQANNSRGPVGFINPALYTIAAGPSYASCFHDITTGNNKWSQSPALFNAVPGYDLCTGLGTPNGPNLLNVFLAGTFTNPFTHISAPPKPYGTTLSAMNGSNPNGNWNLFIMSDTPPDTGAITNGWLLTLVTANPVGLEADGGVTMTASTTNALQTTIFGYTITVTNYGPSISSNVLVTDPLSPLVALVTSNATLGTIIHSGSTVIWNVGTLAPGTGAQMTLLVQAVNAGLAVNTITASSDTSDANPADDTATVLVTINPVSPLEDSASGFNGSHQFQLTINGGAGLTNIVQMSTNLSNPNGWVPVYTNYGATPFTFTDTKSTNSPVRFYRDISF